MFENTEVAIDSLPHADGVDWRPLHPSYSARLRTQSALTLAVVGVGITAAGLLSVVGLRQLAALWLLLLVVAAAVLAWPAVSVPRCGYVLRERDILFRKGVVWRSVTGVPFNRIQHVETGSTPLDRKFGLATLQLFTAGGSGGDLRIRGLGAGVAESLRVHILEKAGASIESD